MALEEDFPLLRSMESPLYNLDLLYTPWKFGTLWGSNLQSENPFGSVRFIHLQDL